MLWRDEREHRACSGQPSQRFVSWLAILPFISVIWNALFPYWSHDQIGAYRHIEKCPHLKEALADDAAARTSKFSALECPPFRRCE